ncbi:MAG: inorganic diphosphatase [Pseudomonadota bacterium]
MVPLNRIALGVDPPDDINAFVTCPSGTEPMQIGLDQATGAFTLQAVYNTAMRTPGNLGLVPRTAGEDGAPLNIMIVGLAALPVGTVVGVRPLGVLYVISEAEEETVLAVPAPRIATRFEGVANYADLPTSLLRQVEHFAAHYRDEDAGLAPRSCGWGDVNEARRVVREAAHRARIRVGATE